MQYFIITIIHQFVNISQLRALLVFVFSVMMNDIVNWYKYCFNQTIDCVSLLTLMQILQEYKKSFDSK